MASFVAKGLELHMRKRDFVLIACLLISPALYRPLAIDPFISPEFDLDNPVWVGASGFKRNLRVTTGDQAHLVIWNQEIYDEKFPGMGTYGALISVDGKLIGSAGIQIPLNVHAAVAANGDEFLVVWGSLDQNLRAIRLNSQGAALEQTPIEVGGRGYEVTLAVYLDGYLLAYSNGGTISTKALSRKGDPLGGGSSLNAGDAHMLEVASNGTLNLLTWATPDGIFCIRLTNQGRSVDSAPLRLYPDGIWYEEESLRTFPLRVSSDGQDFLVVWSRNDLHVYGMRVSGEGKLLDSAPLLLLQPHSSPDITFDGSSHLLIAATDDPYKFVLGRVSSKGLMEGSLIPILAKEDRFLSSPAITSHAGRVLVAWLEGTIPGPGPEDQQVRAAILAPDQTLGEQLLLTRGPNRERAPAAAANSSGYLVVWQDNRLNPTQQGEEIYGARFNKRGLRVDSDAIPICTNKAHQSSPAVAWNGTDFFVAWRDRRNGNDDIFGARVTAQGQVLDPTGVAICTEKGDQRAAAVAASRTQYLVVWRDSRAGRDTVAQDDILGARVTFAGQVLDSQGFFICGAPHVQEAPTVASNGENFMVVWRHWPGDLYANIVRGDGSVSTRDGFPVAQSAQNERAPRITSNGADYFLMWRAETNILAQRFSATGQPKDRSPAKLEDSGMEPAVSFDGRQYQLAWLTQRQNRVRVHVGLLNPLTGTLQAPVITFDDQIYNPDVLQISAAQPNSLLILNERVGIPPRAVGHLLWWGPLIQDVRLLLDGVHLTWLSKPGKSYRVEYADDLGTTTWIQSSGLILSTGTETSFVHPNPPQTAGFYRIVELP